MKHLICKALVGMTFFVGFNAVAADRTEVPNIRTGTDQTPQMVPGATLVSAEYLKNLELEIPGLVIIDNRNQFERDKGFIPGSVSMTEEEIKPETMRVLVKSRETPVAFYCDDAQCMSSVYAARLAVKEGYKKVYWFRGGLAEWRQYGFDLVGSQ